MILTYIGDENIYEIKNVHIVEKGRIYEIIPYDGETIPVKTTGFCLQNSIGSPACNFADFTTVYRIIENKIQFSNDGSVWVEPLKNVKISVIWNDNDNAEGTRPSSVKVDVYDNDGKVETATLNEKNHWSREYTDIPESQIYHITAKDIEGYEKVELGANIIYTDPTAVDDGDDEYLSKDEQIEQLTSLVNDLVERIKVLESK